MRCFTDAYDEKAILHMSMHIHVVLIVCLGNGEKEEKERIPFIRDLRLSTIKSYGFMLCLSHRTPRQHDDDEQWLERGRLYNMFFKVILQFRLRKVRLGCTT